VHTIISVSTLTVQAIKHKNHFIFPWKELDTLKSKTLPAYAYKYNCQYSLFDLKAYEQDRCVYPENIDKANVFLIGDSNAAHYLGMLRVFSDHYGFSIRNATQSSCPMVFDNEFKWVGSRYKKGCSIYSHSIENETKKYDTVIVGGSWNGYYRKKGFQEEFSKTIEQLSKNTKYVILLAKVPLFPKYNKDCEIRAIRLNSLECSTRFNNTLTDNISNTFLRDIANKYSNVHYFDARKQLCKNGSCSPYIDGNPVYYDGGHLSMKGSEQIGKTMIEANDPMLHVFDHLKNRKQSYITPIVTIKNTNNSVTYTINPKEANTQVAFYLYKNDKRIDTQWYSKNLSYKLDKQKFGKGKYRVGYFIVNEKAKDPGKAKKIESGFSEYIEIK